MSDNKQAKISRKIEGRVVSAKMTKTVAVVVERTKIHPKYKKRYKVHKKYLVHDPKEQCRVGDVVTFVECRPISKRKKWRVVYANLNK